MVSHVQDFHNDRRHFEGLIESIPIILYHNMQMLNDSIGDQTSAHREELRITKLNIAAVKKISIKTIIL